MEFSSLDREGTVPREESGSQQVHYGSTLENGNISSIEPELSSIEPGQLTGNDVHGMRQNPEVSGTTVSFWNMLAYMMLGNMYDHGNHHRDYLLSDDSQPTLFAPRMAGFSEIGTVNPTAYDYDQYGSLLPSSCGQNTPSDSEAMSFMPTHQIRQQYPCNGQSINGENGISEHSSPSPSSLHPTDRPFSCLQSCGKFFKRKGDAERHSRIHNAPHLFCHIHGCKFESQGFTRKDKLVSHLRSVHGFFMDPAITASSPNSNESSLEY